MHPIWAETKESNKFGIAIHNFNGRGTNCLKLYVGDAINTVSESKEWFYGYCIKDPLKRGIFPKSYIFLKESVVELQGCYYPKDLPIVREITAVLREWGDLWKKLYLNSLGADRADTMVLKKAMLDLIDSRRLIMSRKLTVDEMREVQQKVSQKIDTGNARLGLDLMIRDDRGNVIDPLKTSTISLFKMHQQATKRINEEKEMSTDTNILKKAYSFNLYVNVKNFVCRIGENANILLTLYDAKEGSFISENYIMKWGDQGMPKDIEMLNNLRVIFMDLSEKDVKREKIFLVCQIIRIGRMDLKECDSKKLAKGMKRPFGVASIEVTDILSGKMDNDDEKQYFIPFLQCGDHDFMDVVIKKSIAAKDINHKGQGLWVTMRNLLGDLTSLQKDYPHLVTNATSIARKMGFPEVIMPGDVRNDLYVTLKQGEFKKGGHKMADKNIEVTLTICNENGEVINNVISEGAGGDMVSHYKSIIYYHEDKPKWFETVKISIPVNESSGVHLKFTMKHRSTSEAKDKVEKSFAMSYIRLMNDDGTTLSDTMHDLLVYKLDTKKTDEASNVYLKLPSTQRELQRMSQSGQPLKPNNISTGSLSLSTSDSFQISTLICSTKLTHNVDLMGLLKWRENPEDLEQLLRAFMFVDGEEIVKFLQDTLDALFNILIENSDSDLYDKLVFDALVFIIGIVSDSKYSQFKPVLDSYVNDSFSATLAYAKLMVVLKCYIEDESMMETVEPVIKAVKSLDYIFKFIVRSRLLFASLNDNGGKQQFEILFCQLFESINNLMKDGRSIKLVVCDCLINILPSLISHVLLVYNPIDFSMILVECINSVPADKLLIRRMHCINSLVHTQLFLSPECRRILLPVMLDHVYSLMSSHIESMHEHNYRDSDPDTTRYNELDICIKILSDVMDYEFKNMGTSTPNEDMMIISKKMLRLVTKTVIYLDKESSLIGNCVAVMTSILRQMTEYQYTQYITRFETPFDLLDYLMEILMIFEELITRNVYPPDWNEMILLQNWVFLNTLKYFSNTIRSEFTTSFCCDLWKRFFLSSIAFIVQKPLQLENFSPAKRNKITSCYKDMRIEAGLEIRSMWNNLGQHKLEFIPEIVGPFLQMTLIPERELRKKTIPIFFDMMQAEFMGSTANIKRNFLKFEHELIDRIDKFVKEGQGDESYKEMFYEIIREKCESHKFMKDQGLTFVDIIKDLFTLLLQYRSVFREDNHDNKMSCIVSLLNFYRDIGRDELYIRCLNELCALHLECENYTEAGYTLMTYAKMLRWTDEKLHSMLLSSACPELDTHRKLKEHLYYEIISCFDKGKVWEMGIELCKELAQQCEVETFDYIQLSLILTKQADLYDSIMKKVRPEPEYFRVGYFGLGFPPFLQNRTFVHRGKEYERLSDFVSRLLNQFPNAQLLKTLNQPGDDIKEHPVQYLQINKVTPVMELKDHLIGKRLSEQILKYFKVNEVQKFTCSRKKDESTNEVSSMWLERTILVTSCSLPGILHWFPVTSTQTVDVSPLELATETIEETNTKLKSLVDQQLSDPTSRIDQLSMVINGVVDAAVNGGIANYKVFYSEKYLKEHPSHEEQMLITRLKQYTTSQLIILRFALDIHHKRAPENLQAFHSHMEQRYAEMKKSLEKDYGIKLKDDDASYEDSDYVSSVHIRRTSSHEQDDFNKQSQLSSSRLNIPLRVHGSSNSPRSEQSPSSSSLSIELRLKGKPSGSRTSFGSTSLDFLGQRQSASPRVSGSSLIKGIDLQNFLSEQASPLRSNKGDSGTLKVQQRQTTAISPTFEDPPPLPKKTSHADYANIEVDLKGGQSDGFLARRDTHKDRPKLPLPTTLPPKRYKKVPNDSEMNSS